MIKDIHKPPIVEKPLTKDEIKALVRETNGKKWIHVLVGVTNKDMHGNVDDFNDMLSVRITGDYTALEDISSEIYGKRKGGAVIEVYADVWNWLKEQE